MRTHIIHQTKIFYKKHSTEGELKFVKFKVWLEKYPFVRTIVRESMMPRIWTLNNIRVVPPVDENDQITNSDQFYSGESTTDSTISSKLSKKQ